MSGLLPVLSILAIESDCAASQGNHIPSVHSAGGLDLHKVTTHFVKAQVTVRKYLSGCQHQRHGWNHCSLANEPRVQLLGATSLQLLGQGYSFHCNGDEILGVEAKFHTQSLGQVVWANHTIVSMLKKYVGSNSKDWDVKLPLVLMTIRGTPHRTTGVAPFSKWWLAEKWPSRYIFYTVEKMSVLPLRTWHIIMWQTCTNTSRLHSLGLKWIWKPVPEDKKPITKGKRSIASMK